MWRSIETSTGRLLNFPTPSGVIEDAIINKFTGDHISNLYSQTRLLREDTAKIGEQVEKLSMDTFYHNVRENGKVLIISGLFQHIENRPGTPYNNAWNCRKAG